MKDHIIKNKVIYSTVITGIQTVIVGIYITLYSNELINGNNPIDSLNNPMQYSLPVVFVLFLFQMYLGMLERKYTITEKEQIINNILRAACSSLLYPNNDLNIRAVITVCDYKTNKRRTKYCYNVYYTPERTGIYDLDFGVTGEAILKRVSVAKALPKNHMSTYSPENAKYVEPELKCVLAAPIFSLKQPETVVAVLAFDSTESIEKVHFDTRKSREIAQMWADVLANFVNWGIIWIIKN